MRAALAVGCWVAVAMSACAADDQTGVMEPSGDAGVFLEPDVSPSDAGSVPDLGPEDSGLPEVGPLPDVGEDAAIGVDISDPDLGTPDSGVPPLAPFEVRIEWSRPRQTMDGIGANAYAYPFVGGTDELGTWDPDAVRARFRTLDIAYVRLVPWTEFWEPVNDNLDPQVTAWSSLMNNPGFELRPAEWFELPALQWLHREGVLLHAGVWLAPAWLRDSVASGEYREVAESIVSYFQYLRTGTLGTSTVTAGVPLEVVEIQNEPDLDAYLPYQTPSGLRDGALAVLDRLDAVGLSNVMVHGPNIAQIRTSTTELPFTASQWIEPWLNNPRLRNRTMAVSFHSWWSDDPADYARVRSLAHQHNKPVWATEVGLCAVDEEFCMYLNYSRFNKELWGSTLDFVESSYRVIEWSDATRVYMWTFAGPDGAIRTDGSTTAHYSGLRHLANYIPPRSTHVDVGRGAQLHPEHPRAMAFVHPDGDKALILLNRGTNSSTVSVRGDLGGPLRVKAGLQSTERRPLQPFLPDPNRVILPPRSITSLILE